MTGEGIINHHSDRPAVTWSGEHNDTSLTVNLYHIIIIIISQREKEREAGCREIISQIKRLLSLICDHDGCSSGWVCVIFDERDCIYWGLVSSWSCKLIWNSDNWHHRILVYKEICVQKSGDWIHYENVILGAEVWSRTFDFWLSSQTRESVNSINTWVVTRKQEI